jgi:cytochrome P450
MQSAADVSLPFLPLYEPAFAADPTPFLEAARREHPWLARCADGYFVHGYQAMRDLLVLDGPLLPAFAGIVQLYGAQGTPWGHFMEETLIALSGDKHARVRASVLDAFSPREVNRNRALIRQTLSDLLDEWAPKGAFDFADFASWFPIAVLCGLLGTSTEAIPALREVLERQVASAGIHRDLLPQLLEGYEVQRVYADTLVAGREAEGRAGDEETLLDTLIARKNAGRIDDEELRYLIMTLMPAAYDTSKNVLTLAMYLLLDHPDHWARCATDRPFCDKVLEEVFRHSSTASISRVVAEPVDYDGIHFPANSLIIFGLCIAGRDPDAFDGALAFDPEREHPNRHMAFGRGAHVCVAQHLARAQIADGLHLIAQRITRPRLAGAVEWRPFLPTYGVKSLPIAFEPAEAGAAAA